jgi:hypothetical protein
VARELPPRGREATRESATISRGRILAIGRRMERLSFFFCASLVVLTACSGGSGTSIGDNNDDAASPAPSPSSDASSAVSCLPGAACPCASGKTCIEADVTMTDGTQFHFAVGANRTTSTSGTTSFVSLTAIDPVKKVGLSVTWKPSEVKTGTPYPSELAGPTYMAIYRPSPKGGDGLSLSSVKGGPITFTSTDDANPAGTFDGIDVTRDTAEDKVHIVAKAGSFHVMP